MVAVFWFLLIRPQRQRRRPSEPDGAACSGDEVVTAGGMIGTLRSVEEDHLAVEIAPGTGPDRQGEAVRSSQERRGIRRLRSKGAAN